MPRIVPRYARIDLEDGIWIDIRVNPPMQILDDFTSEKIDRIIPALARLVQDSNLEDESGALLNLKDPESWKQVPTDFVTSVGSALVESVNPKASPEKPNSGDTSPTESAPPPATTL